MKKIFLKPSFYTFGVLACLFFQASKPPCMEEDCIDPIEVLTRAAFESFIGNMLLPPSPLEKSVGTWVETTRKSVPFSLLERMLLPLNFLQKKYESVESIKKDLSLAATLTESLQEELQTQVNAFKEASEKEKQRMTLLEKENEFLKKENVQTKMDKSKLKGELEQYGELQTQVNAFKEASKREKQRMTFLEKDNERLKNENAQTKMNNNKLNGELKQYGELQTQVNAFKEESEREKKRMTLLEKDNESLKKENVQTNMDNNKLKGELKQYGEYQKFKVEVLHHGLYFKREQVAKHPWFLTADQRVVLGNSCAKESPGWINFELLKK